MSLVNPPEHTRALSEPSQVPLQTVLTTQELLRRPARAPDYKGEAQALLTLSRELSASPHTLLQTLCETAMELCGAQSAGVSIQEEEAGSGIVEKISKGVDEDMTSSSRGASYFRWHAVAGGYAPFLNQTMPRDFSLCGVVVDSNAPQHFTDPARHFTYMEQPEGTEALLVPFHLDDRPVGTLWVVKHNALGPFDPEDIRLLTNLATFVTAARKSLLQQAESLEMNDLLMQEVTERRDMQQMQERAEIALRASKEALDLAISAAQLGTFYCDFPLENIVWNDTCMQHFFLPPDTVVNFDLFYSLLHPDDREPTRRAIEYSLSQKAQYNVQYRTLAPDGRLRWINAIGRCYYEESGEPYRFDGITIDITEQKAREQTLNFLVELNDATRALSDPLEIMATVTRMLGEFLGVSQCVYASVEPDGNRFTIYPHYTRDCPSIEGDYLLDDFGPRAAAMREGRVVVICDRDAEATPDDALRGFYTIGIQAVVGTALIKEGQLAAMMAVHQVTPRQWTPAEIGLVEMLAERSWAIIERATTDRRLAERNREIEELNARLQRSIQETHHRVKNNLQVISALAELQIEEGDTVPVAALKRLGQHTRSLAAIHDILTQQVKADAHTDTISVRAILDSLTPLLQATMGGRALRYETDDFLLPVREGASLTLLVSELVSNALKHGAGTITVTLKRQGSAACLTVTDEGRGFAPDFDPRRAANTGLSLIDSTGRHDLQGAITYDNAPGGGAQISVVFPVAV